MNAEQENFIIRLKTSSEHPCPHSEQNKEFFQRHLIRLSSYIGIHERFVLALSLESL